MTQSMKHTIIAKSDQLNADDLIGGAVTVKISKVKVTLDNAQPCTINYEGDNGRPYKPCKGMRRLLVFAWGEDPNNYIGKLLTLFREPTVKYSGKEVGGIEISAMSHVEADFDFAVTVSRGYKKPVRIRKLSEKAATQSAPPAATAAAVADPALMTAGNQAAAKGVTAYVAWRDALAPAVKETIKPHNSAWSKIAKEADAAVAAAKVDEEIPV